MSRLTTPSPAWLLRLHLVLALSTAFAGFAVSAACALDYVRWPVIDMGGVVARMLILFVLATQVVPVGGGLVAALVFRKDRRPRWVVGFWLWFATAVAALIVGCLGAVMLHR